VRGILRRNGWELRGEWKRGRDDSRVGFADAKSARRARTRESCESVEVGAKLGDVVQVRAFSFLSSACLFFLHQSSLSFFYILLFLRSIFVLFFATKGPGATS
jgi:hypothetical protein